MRTNLAPGPAAELLRGTVREIAPAVPISSLATLDAHVDGGIASERLLAKISALLWRDGAAARRRSASTARWPTQSPSARASSVCGWRSAPHEGTSPRLVLRGALTPVCLGLAVGLPLTLAMSRVAGQFLYGITPRDPAAYAASTGVAACRRPAGGRRAGPARDPRRSDSGAAGRIESGRGSSTRPPNLHSSIFSLQCSVFSVRRSLTTPVRGSTSRYANGSRRLRHGSSL